MSEKILIIDYGSGNINSVFNALELVRNPDQEIVISNQPIELRSSSRIILPGVGSFASCFNGLKIIPSLIEELKIQILQNKKPFFGICVGMQLLADIGYEHVVSKGLGFIHGRVEKIKSDDQDLKIPHMGWNDLEIKNRETGEHPVLKEIKTGDHFYFVHSYHFICNDDKNVLAVVDYGGIKINAIIARDNIFATQFHPEKSSNNGLKMIKNFLNWKI